VSLDLKGKTAIADYMVIATGTSSRQVAGVAAKLRDKLAAEGYRARIEGQQGGDWVILDAGDVIVHLFRAEVRAFYSLEKLWGTDFSTVGYNLYTST
jgi:ribosome-associated protein